MSTNKLVQLVSHVNAITQNNVLSVAHFKVLCRQNALSPNQICSNYQQFHLEKFEALGQIQ